MGCGVQAKTGIYIINLTWMPLPYAAGDIANLQRNNADKCADLAFPTKRKQL
jgi:hypothetical protein